MRAASAGKPLATLGVWPQPHRPMTSRRRMPLRGFLRRKLIAPFDFAGAIPLRPALLSPVGSCAVGATLVVARVGRANTVHHATTGDHKGRPYGNPPTRFPDRQGKR